MKTFFAVLCVLALSPVFAADIEQALKDALENDPVIAQADAQRRLGKQQVPRALGALLPNLGISRSQGRSETRPADQVLIDPQTGQRTVIPGMTRESDSKGWGISVSQTVFNAGALLGVRTAQLRSKQADETYQSILLNLYIRVARAYLDVLRAQSQVESTDAAEQAVKRQLEQARQRFEVGLVAVTDVLDATAQYDNAIVNQIQARSNHDIKFEDLGSLTGVRYADVSRLGADMPIQNPAHSEAEWVRMAVDSSPEIKGAKLSFEAQKKQRNATLSQHLPRISASWGRSYSEGGFNFLGDNESNSFSLSLSMTLFNAGQLLNSRNSYLEVESAKQNMINQQLTVARNVRTLYRTVVTDVVRVEARRKAIESSSAALEATETGYQVGTRDIVDVLLAQQRLFHAQNAFAGSRYDYVLNHLQLKQSAGSLAEQDLLALNQYLSDEDPVVRLN